jgi:hypothetical protein
MPAAALLALLEQEWRSARAALAGQGRA